MKLRVRLIGSFLAVATLCAVVGIVSMVASKQFAQLAVQSEHYADERAKFDQLEKDHLSWVSTLKDYAYGAVNDLNVQTDDHKCRMGQYLYNGGLDELRKIDPEIAGVMDTVKRSHFELHESAKAIEQARIQDGGLEKIGEILGQKTAPSLGSIRTILKTVNDNINHAQHAILDKQEKSKKSQSILLLLTILAGFAIAMGLGLWLTRDLMIPVRQVVDLAKAIKLGDTTQRIRSQRRDEFGEMAGLLDEMAGDLDGKTEEVRRMSHGDLTVDVKVRSEKDTLGRAIVRMNDNLNTVIGKISMASEQVSAGSGEVSSASQSLSQGATQQAASLQEITSSITEIGSQTKTNAENAGQARNIVTEMKQSAETGNLKMQSMVDAMDAIKTSAREISKIIKVIDDIAFQTNLLALNAAVEAARAGVHGKGFAVVAEEVRGLAGRSAKAARETSELIEGAIKKVESGTRVADEMVEALEKIFGGVSKTSDLINEIAAASTEQAQGVNQIAQGLHQIDDVTQKNTASAEETASAAEELSSQSAELRAMLQQFTLKNGIQQPMEGGGPMHTPAVRARSGWGNAQNPDVSGLISSNHPER